MKAWQTSGYNGVSGVSLCTVRVPPILRPGDILVRVVAASVNPIDTAVISKYLSYCTTVTAIPAVPKIANCCACLIFVFR